MAQEKKQRINGDLSEYILLVLLKENNLTAEQIQEKVALQTIDFGVHEQSRRRRLKREVGVAETCEGMVCKKLLIQTEARYQLTSEGRLKAEVTAAAMEQGAALMQNQLLSPTAAARNTTVGYVILAILKLLAGFFTGSVGLIADGADTTVDTAASGIVWAGIKFKKEILGTIAIIGLMFVTAGILFYDSLGSIVENVQGIFVPMSMPYVVIIVELMAVLSMFVMSVYQRFVGKRSQSLALISQSIDSKNSVYSSAAVIVGAVSSLFGFYWVDAVVGAFIAVRICLDSFGLTREVYHTLKGAKPEFSKYKLPFEKQIGERRRDNFRNWIMYQLQQNKSATKAELVASLEKTFRPDYMPQLFTEFTAGREFDFADSFGGIIKPLMEAGYVKENSGVFALTDSGKVYIKGKVSSLRFKETEL